MLMGCQSGGLGYPQSSALPVGISHREAVHLTVFCASHIQALVLKEAPVVPYHCLGHSLVHFKLLVLPVIDLTITSTGPGHFFLSNL